MDFRNLNNEDDRQLLRLMADEVDLGSLADRVSVMLYRILQEQQDTRKRLVILEEKSGVHRHDKVWRIEGRPSQSYLEGATAFANKERLIRDVVAATDYAALLQVAADFASVFSVKEKI